MRIGETTPNDGNEKSVGEAKRDVIGRGTVIDGTAPEIGTDGGIEAANGTAGEAEAADAETGVGNAEIIDGEGLVHLDMTDVDHHHHSLHDYHVIFHRLSFVGSYPGGFP